MRCFLPLCFAAAAFAAPPKEPVEIGDTPQFLIDDHIVDNRWSLKPKTEEVVRVFHAPKKHERNPLIIGDCGYPSVTRDGDTFKLWYQTHSRDSLTEEKTAKYAIAYAES